jgi:hypothetical protein
VFDAVPESPEFPDHFGSAALRPMFGHRRSAFLVHDALMQDLPNEPTQSVRNGPDRLPRHDAAPHEKRQRGDSDKSNETRCQPAPRDPLRGERSSDSL